MAPPPSAKPAKITGVDNLRDSRLAKGMATTIEERQLLGIHGLLPPRVKTQAEQVSHCLRNVRRYSDPLDQYVYLMDLLERNERLFYCLLSTHTEELMPIVYTPTVGEACQKFGFIFRRPQGLFITIKDKGHIIDVLRNWPRNDVKAICVTDGERILGLGDLGAQGMGIPVGKLALYTALADIPPYQTLPIVLDVGTNREELRTSEDYIGLRQPRTEGAEYDEFMDEFMEAVVKLYGQSTLIQFEDFGKNNAFRLLEKYRDSYCTFNDDIQGTASVALAGILAALRASGKKLTDHTFLFQGAGQAAVGIAMLIAMAMEKREGVTREDALKRIWLRDSKGLVVKDRPDGGISEPKEPFAHEHGPMTDLMEIIEDIKPTCLIGAAAIPNVFTPEVIKTMASLNEKPIIFALSNPTSKAECTAEAAYTHSEGRAIFASGSPFPTFEGFGKTFEPGQGNNAYIFPGLSLGIISAGIRHVHESIFLFAAEGLANLVTEEDLSLGRMYPPLSKIKNVSIKIATKVAEEAYKEGMASTYPEPKFVSTWLKLGTTMSGAVSEEVWRKIRVQFDSLDKNRDGKITVKEVEEVLAAQNLDYSPQKIRVLIEKADTNRDGLVNWNEFLALMTSEMKVNNTGHLNLEDNEPVDVTEILRAFKMFDDDNNGTIDITEFKKAMRELEIGDTDQKLEKLFFDLDVNSDGQIDATEFVALFKKE